VGVKGENRKSREVKWASEGRVRKVVYETQGDFGKVGMV
jgi:hypothetical protein